VGRMNRDFAPGPFTHGEVEQFYAHTGLANVHPRDETVVAVHP